MAKEKVYIVLSHKHNLKRGTRDQWEVQEQVEFVSQLRNRHTQMSSAIGDYLNETMVSGVRHGFGDYAVFEDYIAKKYKKQLEALKVAYPRASDAVQETVEEVVDEKAGWILDEFGNERAPTVFDKQ